MFIPHATWKTFIERRTDIESVNAINTILLLLPIQDLIVELVKIYGKNNVKE